MGGRLALLAALALAACDSPHAQLLAEGRFGALAAQGDELFAVSGSELRRYPKQGGPGTSIASRPTMPLGCNSFDVVRASPDFVYWKGANDLLERISRTNGAIEAFQGGASSDATGSRICVEGLHVDGDVLAFVQSDGNSFRTLWTWPLDGDPVAVVTDDGPRTDFAVDAQAFYWFDADKLVRLDRASQVRATIARLEPAYVQPVGYTSPLTLADDSIYWLGIGTDSAYVTDMAIFRVARSGGPVERVASMPLDMPPAEVLVHDGSYFVGGWRLRQGESQAEQLLPRGGAEPYVVTATAIDDAYIYWVESAGRLYRYPLDGAVLAQPPGTSTDGPRPPFL